MDILPFGILITRFLLIAGVIPDVAEPKRELMGPINSTILSRSTWHSRLHLRRHVPAPVDPQRGVQPGDYGVSATGTSKQIETLVYSATGEDMVEVVRAAISGQISALINAVRMEVQSAVSEFRTEITDTISELRMELDAMSVTQITISTWLTQIEERIVAVEEICKKLEN